SPWTPRTWSAICTSSSAAAALPSGARPRAGPRAAPRCSSPRTPHGAQPRPPPSRRLRASASSSAGSGLGRRPAQESGPVSVRGHGAVPRPCLRSRQRPGGVSLGGSRFGACRGSLPGSGGPRVLGNTCFHACAGSRSPKGRRGVQPIRALPG
ncbi:unnamed protein product, partial [Prorocentrum cordatum]